MGCKPRESTRNPWHHRLGLLYVFPLWNRRITHILPVPNPTLQRTPGFGVQFTSAAVVRPAQSRAVLPAMKPGTSRAFASRRRAHTRAPGPESLSLWSLGVSSRLL